MLEIHQLPLLKDNYGYLLRDEASGKTAIIDPAEPRPVADFLRARGWGLDFILNTHHHWDHTGGNLALQAEFGAQVAGPRPDTHRIPGIEIAIGDGESFRLGGSELVAFHVPGHTTGHTAYYSAADAALFCGDTLFTLGCGFLFEGTPEQMWASLDRLRKLPGATRVFCGHEYTLENSEFALHFDSGNAELKKYVERARALFAAGKPTVPSRMADECKANPFLRADDPGILMRLGMGDPNFGAAFGKIRRLKNEFDDAQKQKN